MGDFIFLGGDLIFVVLILLSIMLGVILIGQITNTVPGRKCPACAAKGQTVWVIPGKCCPQCETPVNRRPIISGTQKKGMARKKNNKKIFFSITWVNYFFCNNIPKPASFVNITLKSNLDLLNIISDLNTLLPQLADFINQFHIIVNQSGINVVTDVLGNMSIDVPKDMPDSVADNIGKRIGIIDRLITTRGQQINELLQNGLTLENKVKMENTKYISQLSDKIAEFKKLNDSFRH